MISVMRVREVGGFIGLDIVIELRIVVVVPTGVLVDCRDSIRGSVELRAVVVVLSVSASVTSAAGVPSTDENSETKVIVVVL